MEKKDRALRYIPSVDSVLKTLRKTHPDIPHAVLRKVIRVYLQELREKLLDRQSILEIQGEEFLHDILLTRLQERLSATLKPRICRAINATGVILHTGLGRAVLPPDAIKNLCRELSGYSVLEIDPETGERKNRDTSVCDMLCNLTGSEDATVVNNNAAAVLLIMAALAQGKEVIVSRGQLVEIGGTFRVPEVISQSDATLVEVGCTNKVYVADYRNAISDRTAAILSVHTSNFKVMGFTHEVSLEDLVALAREKGIPLIQDAGSGALLNVFSWGLGEEPLISASIGKGADIVSFSGDKLLGSCQAGIIVGKKVLVDKIRKHPLARALRVDKVTLSILESTLRHYFSPDTVADNVPALKMCVLKAEQIQERAQKIAQNLQARLPSWEIQVVPTCSRAGSGAFPVLDIPSYAVALHSNMAEELAKKLRSGHPPVFVRIERDNVLVDPRTLLPEDDREIVEIVGNACANCCLKK